MEKPIQDHAPDIEINPDDNFLKEWHRVTRGSLQFELGFMNDHFGSLSLRLSAMDQCGRKTKAAREALMDAYEKFYSAILQFYKSENG